MTIPVFLNVLALGTCFWLWRLQVQWPRLHPFQRKMRTVLGLAMASWTYTSALAWIFIAEAARQAGVVIY